MATLASVPDKPFILVLAALSSLFACVKNGYCIWSSNGQPFIHNQRALRGRYQKANELELKLIQTQMTHKPILRAEVYAHAMRASQNRK